MKDLNEYSKSVQEAITELVKNEKEREILTPNEIFNLWCQWELGSQGWGTTIKGKIKEIYDIDLRGI